MTKIVWDQVGTRRYEGGVSKGVLHLKNGTSLPWNGLKSVSKKSDRANSPIYFDGVKVNDHINLGDFSGTITAITYPNDVNALEGFGEMNRGALIGDQQPELFDLSYETLIGNDLDEDAGYKLHLLYNITALPSETSYTSVADSFGVIDFKWDITAVPEEIPGFRPTAHFVFDSRRASSDFMTDLEALVYGTDSKIPNFPTITELTTLILEYFILEIIDNGDGTWSAITTFDDLIIMDSLTQFTIQDIQAIYITNDLYEVSSNRY